MDKQTNKQTEIWINRQKDGKTDRMMDKQKTDIQTNIHTNKQTDRKKEKCTKKRHKQMDKQTDRKEDGQRKHRFTGKCCDKQTEMNVVNAAFLCFETSKLWVLICIFVDR